MTTRRELLIQTAGASLAFASGRSRAATGHRVRIRSAIRREETIIRYPGDGDNFHMSWGADDRQYVSVCDGGGFADPPLTSYNSRMFTVTGEAVNARFDDIPGYPVLARPTQHPKDPRYYGFGTLALDGHLYQFMSTFNRLLNPDDFDKPKDLARFSGVKLIYSRDNGRTWHNHNGSSPVVWEGWNSRSRDTLLFFEEDQDAFALLTILQMGRNYEHNRDGYVYAYAPNGITDGTMNELVMFRVRKEKLLERKHYEYFAGRKTKGQARWSNDIEARGIVHTFPRGWVNRLIHPFAWHPSVVYNAPLDLYMMANWGMGSAPDGMWFRRPSYLGLWTAPRPWGPWTQIHEETQWLPASDTNARAYEPQIAPKWIAPDGKSFWLVWTDYQVRDEAAWNRILAEYQRTADPSAQAAATLALKRRQHMPNYRFNTQRVDFVLG